MARRTRFTSMSVFGIVLAVLAPSAVPGQSRRGLEYNRDIRPILSENCFACHGPDKASRKAGLRLDRREEAVDAGAIVPGDADKSALVERIFAQDPKERMPPAKSGHQLTEAQKQTLRRWIADGAAYQPHWSFIPPERP